jgi:hypothetical protein
MTYRVILQRLAIQDLDDAFVWAARKAPDLILSGEETCFLKDISNRRLFCGR